MKSSTLFKALLQTTAIVTIGFGYANAQTPEADAPEVLTPEAETETTKEKDVVLVTGSRIKRDGFSSDAPVDILTIDDAKLEGISDVGSLLQSATIASGSPQVTAATSSAFVQNGGVGSTTLNLRGLGANRTLSLINGRRAGPSGTRGAVSSFDVNSVPLLALQQVEILKDGASSVYGSDAVAGVVNYITDKSDKKAVDFFATQPEQSGGETYRASGTWGKTFERGRVRVTGDYTYQKELARGQRDYYDCGERYMFNADGSRADVIDPRTGEPQCVDRLWGHVWIYDYGRFFGGTNVPGGDHPNEPTGHTHFPFLAQYDYDGSLAANGLSTYPGPTSIFDMTAPAGWFPIYYDQNDIDYLPSWAGITVGTEARGLVNGDHPFQDDQTLYPKVERITLMADGDIEMGNGVTAYGEALFNRRTTNVNGYRQFWSYNYGETSLFSFAPGDPLAAGWSGVSQWYSPTAITDHSDTKVQVDYMRFVGGMTGGFGDAFGGKLSDWTWDGHLQYSRSDGDYTNDYIRNNSIRPYNFRTSSCVGTNSPDATANGVTSAGLPCVDVPWFDPQFLAGNIDQASRDFLFTTETGNTLYTQFTGELYTTGVIAKVPAGEIAGAFGVQVQRDEINDTPSDIILAGNAWGSSSAGITAGIQKTTALYGEVDIPVVRDKKFMESFDLKVSGRFTDVDTSGSSATYKVGADWQVTPAVRLRGTHGTSFRAPALFELFLDDQVSFSNLRNADPCVNWATGLADGDITQRAADNCASEGIPDDYVGGAITTNIVTGGGLGLLEAETANNYTAGIVFSPEFADLKVSVDYFKIDVNDEVARLGAAAILRGCYNSDVFATEPLCDLFDRNAPNANDANRITELRDSYININQQNNEGIDVGLRYGQDTRFGRLTVDGQATFQLNDQIQLLAEGTISELNGIAGNPKNTGFLRATMEHGPWTGAYRLDYIGKTDDELSGLITPPGGLYGNPVVRKIDSESIIYHTTSISREVGDDMTFVIGVNNIFGEEPPARSVGSLSSRVGAVDFSSQYDQIGRRVFVNVSKTF